MSATQPRTAGRGLLGNSFALLAACHITSVLGYLFWLACARGVSASTVGMASTVISAMTLVAVFAAAGLEPLLTRVLPGADRDTRSGLSSTAIVLTAVVAGVAGAVGGLLMPERLQSSVGTGWLVVLLSAGAVGTALQLVVNAALLGARRAELSLVGCVVGSLLRLGTVIALLSVGVMATSADATAAHTILAVWVASLLISFGLSARLLARATPGFRFRPGWIWMTRLRRGVAWDHVTMLAARLPGLSLPILAAAHFPPAQVAYLVMALMLSGAFFAVSASVANSLLADCADRPEHLAAQARRALRLTGMLLILPVVITCLLASRVLDLFGADYGRHSFLLVLLLLATLPDAMVNFAVAILRVQCRLGAAAAVTITSAAITVGGAWLLMPRVGIIGAAWAVLAAPVLVATALPVITRLRLPARACAASTEVGAPAWVDAAPLPVVGITPPGDVALPEIPDRIGRP